MSSGAHQIVWFDLPVRDLDRAIRFYSAVLAAEIEKQTFPGGAIGILPHSDEAVGGCLFVSDDPKAGPADHGPLLYFNANGRLDEAEAAVEPNGGRVLQAKHSIGPHGFRAVVLDSEGNRIAIHSR
jgi:hypothetical protein